MRNKTRADNQYDYSIQLTILSGEIIKTGLNEPSRLSVSCDISAMPGVNFTIIISARNQDIGSIGSIYFENNRPNATANINFPEECFVEFKNLLATLPPRPPSLFLKTSKYIENMDGEISFDNSGSELEVYDISWRYPLV